MTSDDAPSRGWADEPESRLHDLMSELAREGKLNRHGQKGLITHFTLVFENIAEDGDTWWGILQMPSDGPREMIVHSYILQRHITGVFREAEDDDEEGG